LGLPGLKLGLPGFNGARVTPAADRGMVVEPGYDLEESLAVLFVGPGAGFPEIVFDYGFAEAAHGTAGLDIGLKGFERGFRNFGVVDHFSDFLVVADVAENDPAGVAALGAEMFVALPAGVLFAVKVRAAVPAAIEFFAAFVPVEVVFRAYPCCVAHVFYYACACLKNKRCRERIGYYELSGLRFRRSELA